MSLDGNMIRHITKEYQNVLITGRINKIYQTSKYDLLFLVNTKLGKKQLLISSSPNYARTYLTEYKMEKPDQPPTFCMFLRKQLESGIIKDVYQHLNDRIIVFTIEKRNEMGDLENKFLILEMMGRHSNIIVTDESYKIKEAIKHNMPFEGNDRTIFPGAIYEFPKTSQLNPYNEDELQQFLEEMEYDNVVSMQKSLMGFSPLITNEIMYRYNLNKQSLRETILAIINEYNPTLILGNKDVFYYTDITSIVGDRKHFESISQLLDRYYYDRDSIDIIKQKSKDIFKLVKNNLVRVNHKIEKLQRELKDTSKREKFRIYGELVKANLYQIKKGDSSITCINYYDNLEVTIPLDEKLNAVQNSEKYFKKYKKLKASIPYINEQIKFAKTEKRYFEQLEQQIDFASLKDIEEIKEELISKKYMKGSIQKKKKTKKLNYDIYKDPIGIEIIVGKNNLQNEYITHKLAKHNEVWFHTKDAPGSHVVVKKPFPLEETTIRTAAQLAAYFSKMKNSSSVAVDYVEVRYIKKIPGRINSFVTYQNQKTIYIDPDEDYILSLEKQN